MKKNALISQLFAKKTPSPSNESNPLPMTAPAYTEEEVLGLVPFYEGRDDANVVNLLQATHKFLTATTLASSFKKHRDSSAEDSDLLRTLNAMGETLTAADLTLSHSEALNYSLGCVCSRLEALKSVRDKIYTLYASSDNPLKAFVESHSSHSKPTQKHK